MDEKDYIEFAKTTDRYPNGNRIEFYTFGITEEAGEVAGKIKRVYRDDSGRVTLDRRMQILTELGDLLWYMVRMVDVLSSSMDEVREINHLKLSQRVANNTLHGSGDNR